MFNVDSIAMNKKFILEQINELQKLLSFRLELLNDIFNIVGS